MKSREEKMSEENKLGFHFLKMLFSLLIFFPENNIAKLVVCEEIVPTNFAWFA